jgi:hypothetical protein
METEITAEYVAAQSDMNRNESRRVEILIIHVTYMAVLDMMIYNQIP